ncbi:STAS-like domain-containing protein [Candidatus Woesearchaeota archaeon]|nr:STAS-like domain-containing protein [Candidatus Woesearchaeota archaeon]
MIEIRLSPIVGDFAENKDLAREIRNSRIIPALEAKEDVVLDFEGVESATQSFIHALVSEVIRKYGIEVLDAMAFRNCNETVKKIISIVVDYMQETD